MSTQQHLPSVNHSARDLYAQHVGEATNPRRLRFTSISPGPQT